MTDKELLELAAEAAGVNGVYRYWYDGRDNLSCGIAENGRPGSEWWNPLTSDGDALRLAVKLGLSLHVFHTGPIFAGQTMTSSFELEIEEDSGNDPYAATRRAITRAAAEIGKMKGEKES